MSTQVPAADPAVNATVLASAGTGKTWLLVTRMIRLLLAGARPEGILAVTFTRKAAAEMLSRLSQRLREFAALDDRELAHLLAAIDAPADARHVRAARGLFERMLFAERPLRATTFHAFCQEILQRFPLEANIPPEFELLESPAALQQEAWEALYSEATRAPQSAVAEALETLLDRCGSLHSTQTALASFLHHRSDWWAFTEQWADPVAGARAHLAATLELETGTDPLQELKSDLRGALVECMELLQRHNTAAYQDAAARIARWLAAEQPDPLHYDDLRLAFFTQQSSRRKRSPSAAQRKSMGADGELRLLDLHDRLCAAVERADELLARVHNLELSGAWYLAGARLVEHFQRLKREQRFLDFADLEWRAYQLLNRADNAHWVQYKLDQRIDHLLVDEFQDTNPTQWRLLTPLLEELAAGVQERARSVFLVGDDKQSIYRFRRAEPQLLSGAAAWLQQHMAARVETLEKSWRSSPAVIAGVNAVFEGPLAGQVHSFRHHHTHRESLWGAVELLPLADNGSPAEPAAAASGLRNPLQQPRELVEDQRHVLEGRQVAARIAQLLRDRTPIQVEGGSRPVSYDDIFILMRTRTHAGALERALREAAIPYLGAGRGTLLESLEVSDMEALLTVLTTPYDNLALAQVLRAPIFSAGENDLLQIAEHAQGGNWRTALDLAAARCGTDAPLTRAHRLLSRWEALAGRIPVHDLLDRIYHEGNVPARYEAAYPQALRPRVRANLARFLSLALEVDSGRYPSLPRFIDRLRQLRRNAQEAPDEPPAESAEARVRLMTVHAAKGLEAPVVFLVDCASSGRDQRAHNALVDWPPGQPRPQHFLLTAGARMQDGRMRQLLEGEQRAAQREDHNLLYVALTRARQYLFVSASAPRNGTDLGWYGLVREALGSLVEPAPDGTLRLTAGDAQPYIGAAAPSAPSAPAPDPRLGRPLAPEAQDASAAIRPSAQGEPVASASGLDDDGRPRGIALHRMLELLTGGATPDAALHRAAAEVGMPGTTPQLGEWLEEAQALLWDPELAHLFVAGRFLEAYNELPLQFVLDGRTVSGVIDRLVLTEHEVLIIDYKSHRLRDGHALDALSAAFTAQLDLYAQGARRLWPQRRIRAFALFTYARRLCELGVE